MTAPILDFPPAAALDELPLPAPTALCSVLRVQDGQRRVMEDEVIEEVPVALVYNGISHAVMLASPADLEDFALGFSLGEGILAGAGELYDLDVRTTCDGISVEMTISTARFMALKARRRSLAGRTGCGLCGVDSLASLTRVPGGRLPRPGWALSVDAVGEALRQLPHWQTLRQQTGAAHGAAWVGPDGAIRCLREDVGRHNALDKLVGALARQGAAPGEGFVLISSRASYEMVQKAASAGIGTLVAVSAPTAMAARQAEAVGMLLIGFARPQQLVAYSCADRLGPEAAAHGAGGVFM